jgi:hypoxanthine phosphoribosyltransferase
MRLAARVLDSGYRPNLVLGVWRGGTPVAIAVHEYFMHRGLPCEHAPVKVSYYAGIDQPYGEATVRGIDAVLDLVRPDTVLLVVDDVWDTGRSIRALLDELQAAAPQTPAEIRVACPWYKPARNRTGRPPDYWLHETGDWLVFPHELVGLTPEEIRAGKPELAPVVGEAAGE